MHHKAAVPNLTLGYTPLIKVKLYTERLGTFFASMANVVVMNLLCMRVQA